MPERSDLIAVRTEVVMTAMVESLVEDAAAREAEAFDAVVEVLLGRAAAAVDLLDGEPHRAVTRLARRGFHARHCELERFSPAREAPPADLAARLAGDDWAQVAGACLGLVREEPVTRPDPSDRRAVSWRVPGPGGHVRHYVALRTIGGLPDAVAALRAAGATDPAPLKRAWLFGFLLAEADRLRGTGD